tara:strand:+ start:889 stop:2202 length:1314 start_codon:yes stop_codon:yes gene_type:complete
MGIARGTNIVTNGLIYGHDTGHNPSITGLDSQPHHNDYRFYKGVPDTNVISSGIPGYFGSGGTTLYQKTLNGFSSASGVFQRNYVTNPAQANTGTYNNNAGLFHSGLSFNSLSANTEYIMISFDFYMITPYVRHSSSGTGLNGYLGVTYTDGSGGNHGWNTSLAGNAGDDWNNNSAYVGKWRKIALIADLTDSKTPSSINAMYIYNDRTIQGEGIFTNFVITEHTTLPTSPVQWIAQNGSRSNTQCLNDLASSSIIDVSNVSFDSTGQPTFDGTSDYFTTSHLSTPSSTKLTFESIFKFNGSLDSNDRKVFHWDKTGSSNAVAQIRKGTNNGRLMYQHHNSQWYTLSVDDVVTANDFIHIVVVHSGTTATMYKNGTQVGTTTVGSLNYTNAAEILVGYRANAEYWKGDIPVLKVYDVALSTTQITQNYNAYKNRFNL